MEHTAALMERDPKEPQEQAESPAQITEIPNPVGNPGGDREMDPEADPIAV